ncbi:MAG: M6 family metalloprotease domain-containing protein [Alloprevotella sp.]|nr:M6 family metalloprotease domain-containing protein [Alloprevotella sp.]
MRRIFTLFLLMMMVLSVSAIPAKPGQRRVLTLENGTKITATLVGDEFGHFYRGEDGKAYRLVAGTTYYAETNESEITTRANQRRTMANKQRSKRLGRQKVGSVGSYTGKKKGVVILVNFTDTKFKAANNLALFKRIANEEGFSEGDFYGSMYDYFKAQSDGQFELTFDVVGPVTVSNSYSYYGENDSNGDDLYAGQMVCEAVRLADSQVNFADYDWDGDGYVDQVYVIYAGQGAADGGSDDTIWPHAYDLYSANYYGDGEGVITLDGVKINTYACGPELNGNGDIEGNGTMCHEFSHCLGYPDFYDTDYSGGQGMYSWDLMDYGSYNGDGYRPAGYTSYERWAAGWLTPIELTTSETVTGMKPLTSGGNAYIIHNDAHYDEYFLLENRQLESWDGALPGPGLLIVHVDYSETAWLNNKPNDDPSHQRMTWVPSDGDYNKNSKGAITTANQAADVFPSATVNKFGLEEFGNKTAKMYNANSEGGYYLNVSVEDITQNADGTISFNFKGVPSVATPTFSPGAGLFKTPQNVTLSCATDGATIYYTLDGSEPTTSSTKYTTAISVTESTTIKAVAEKDGELSRVAIGKYVIRAGATSTKFKKVTSLSEMVNGNDYIIACGDKAKAAGALSGKFLAPVDVVVDDDVITINDDVTVFTLEGSGSSWTIVSDDGYLYSTATKTMAFSTTEQTWTLGDDGGIMMSYGTLGSILYNVGSPRFTTYTSTPNANMLYAYLYMATDDGTTETVEAPTFNPEGGTYTTAQNVTLTTTTAGANIYYTLDGTEPTASSTKYTAPISVSTTTTIKAIAEKDGETSTVSSATYTIIDAGDTTNQYRKVNSLSELVSGQQYVIACETKSAVAGSMNGDYLMGAAATVSGDIITVGSDATIFTLEGSGSSWTIHSADGYLYAMKTKKLDYSNDASTWTLSVDDGVILTDDSWGTMLYNSNPGSERFTVYTSSPTATMIQAHLFISMSAPVATVAAPTFNPAGGTYTTAQSVTISTTTAGATIYYTLDGTTPTTSSTKYTGPITVDDDTTIMAIAEKDGETSGVEVAEYIIEPVVDTSLKFTKATSVTPGKRYLIIYNIGGTLKTQNPYSGTKTYGYLYANTSVADADGVISVENDDNVFTFESTSSTTPIIGRSVMATSDEFYIKDSQDRYLYQTGTYNNFNLSTSRPASGGVWTATPDGSGQFTIQNTETGKWMQYSTTYNSTGAYSTAQSGGLLPYLYEETISTGIDTPTIDVPKNRQGVYTLTGVRLPNAENLPSGVYIINGQKVLVK